MRPAVRRSAYLISSLAVVFFFAFPEPNLAIIGALLLQTLAYIVIAGKSAADGIVLTGITVLLIGLIPADHPLIHGDFFEHIRIWIILFGLAMGLGGILMIGWQYQGRPRR